MRPVLYRLKIMKEVECHTQRSLICREHVSHMPRGYKNFMSSRIVLVEIRTNIQTVSVKLSHFSAPARFLFPQGLNERNRDDKEKQARGSEAQLCVLRPFPLLLATAYLPGRVNRVNAMDLAAGKEEYVVSDVNQPEKHPSNVKAFTESLTVA